MARAPDQRAEEARKLFDSGMKLIEISEKLGVPEGTVRSWKNRYKWNNATLQKEKCNVARKKGGQPGNKNAKGHGGTGPPGNKNAVKTGEFEALFFDTLDVDEQKLIQTVQPDIGLRGLEGRPMKLRRNRVETFYHRKRIVEKDSEGSTRERYGTASLIYGESWPASGKVQAQQYGQRLNYIRNLRISGKYEIKPDEKVRNLMESVFLLEATGNRIIRSFPLSRIECLLWRWRSCE